MGASQYFVPRLLRHEFRDVIQEPAELSGNRISERLVQRLLYDIGQGQDQLPVLQHALRRIWLAADSGREEMDLVHYAMVGGLADELPPEDLARFAKWRDALPAHQQQFLLGSPGLRNVLDAHANQLYFEANDLYNRDFQPLLPPGTAERVIEQTFRVLTRTDGKRVVRNRVTGAQLTAILGDAALPWPVVCRILRPFREEGTTFLGPFLSEGDDDHAVLPPDAVLDISHESLIRNWGQLTEWAQHESKDLQIASDFKQQAGRWLEKKKDRGYLLPIGLYRFFSDWYANKKGADGWLAYYQSTNPEASLGQGSVAAQIHSLKSYLETSRRHLWSELLAARYGLWRLAGLILLPIVLLAAVLWWWHHRQEQSDYVANQLVQSGIEELKKSNQLLKDRAKVLAATRHLDTLVHRYEARLAEMSDSTGKAKLNKLYSKALTQRKNSLTDLRSLTLPVSDIARFIITADRLKGVVKDGIYRPWIGSRPAYSFPQMLDTLQNAPAALEVELSMYASVDNLGYDQIEGENPSAQPILRDLVRRLAQAGDITKPIGRSTVFSEQRLLAVLTARTIMALSYYLTSDSLYRAKGPLPAAGQALHHAPATRQDLAKQRTQLLHHLREYVRQETRATAGETPESDGFAYCLQVLLGQGHDGPVGLEFLEHLNPFSADSVQFRRLLGGKYSTAAIAFAALNRTDMVARCLDTLAQRRMRGESPALTSQHIDLLPYLAKYQLLTRANTAALLAKCGQANWDPFNRVYAAATYGLLSMKPSTAVFQASENSSDDEDIQNGLWNYSALLGYKGISYPDLDLVSFALPVAARDTAWAALQAAAKASADQDVLVAGTNPENPKANALFFTAFWAKMHGVYLHEFKYVAEPFGPFDQAFRNLQQALGGGATGKPTKRPGTAVRSPNQHNQRINAADWDLTLTLGESMGDVAQAQSVQDPLAYLGLPTRPRTLDFAAYYTCSFDSFFLHQLAQSTAKPAMMRLLDSIAFREAGFPDRNNSYEASLSANKLFKSGLNRNLRYSPNLSLIKAIARPNLPGDSIRRQRNALLLAIEEALQNRGQLKDSIYSQNLTRQLVESARGLHLSTQRKDRKFFKEILTGKKLRTMPKTSRSKILRVISSNRNNNDKAFMVPIAVAFSDLATAMAHEGRVAEGFALANSLKQFGYLGEWSVMPTTIRVGEQAMLTNNRQVQTQRLINKFLWEYLLEKKAGHVMEKNDGSDVAASIFNLCFWRPSSDKPDSVSLIAPSLIYQLNGEGLNTGLNAPFKAGGLADQVYLARQRLENSPFTLGNSRLRHISYILLGYAHLKARQTAQGWREYDEAELTRPADY